MSEVGYVTEAVEAELVRLEHTLIGAPLDPVAAVAVRLAQAMDEPFPERGPGQPLPALAKQLVEVLRVLRGDDGDDESAALFEALGRRAGGVRAEVGDSP